MVPAEFNNEFDIMYNTASFGGPSLNKYEKSVFLTQAIRELIDEIYPNYEYSEFSKRALNPLISESVLTAPTLEPQGYYKDIVGYDYTLPGNIYYILQENVAFTDPECDATHIEIIAEDLDNLNKTIKNPFKKPNKRKILRSSIGGNKVRLYSPFELSSYKIKYIRKYSPIVLSDFASDPELVGDETIDGINVVTNTELPVFLHDKIVKRGVILAIKSLRENSLKTQIEV